MSTTVPTVHTPIEVWQEYKRTKSPRLRETIARQNDGLALKIAHRMTSKTGESIDDLSQIARIGLWQAIDRFDPDRSVAFSSFAVPWIRGAIMHFLRDSFGLLKIPRRYFEQVGTVRRLCKKLEAMGRTADPEKVAQACGIAPKKWQAIVEATQRKQLADFDDQHHLATEEDEEEEIDRQHRHDRLKRAIAMLPTRQRNIVQAHWFEGQEAAKIARSYKLPVSEVEEALEATIAQLREELAA